ncbi:MAG: hypothetical protein ACI4MI_04925 [Christensenellales bacterium]
MSTAKLASNLTIAKDLSPAGRDIEFKGRIKQAFSAFKNNLTKMITTNLLVMLFLLPLIAVLLFYMPTKETQAIAGMNFSGGLGIGYGAVDDTVAGAVAIYSLRQKFILFSLTPGLMIASIGICGGYYCCRNALWGTKLNVFRTFFRGIAKSWYKFLITFTVLGLMGTGFVYTIFEILKQTAASGAANAGLWVAVVACGLLILATLVFTIIFLPLTVNYSFKYADGIKNSVILALIMFVVALMVVVALCAPMALVFWGIGKYIVYIFVLLFGFSLYTLLTLSFGQYISDGFIMQLYQKQQIMAQKEQIKAQKQAAKNKNKNKKGRR